jgi:hypothetical protein
LVEPTEFVREFGKNKALPYEFSREELAEEELFGHIIDPILDDLMFQEWHAKFHGTSYLTDNECQMRAASVVNVFG